MKNNCLLLLSVALLTLAAILGGCASVPVADAKADAEAKKIEVPAGKALVYVLSYGGSAPFGDTWVNQISVNHVNRGALAYKTYRVYTVEPGDVTVIASTATQAVTKLTAVAGSAYFVQVKSLLFNRVGVEQISEETARQLLQECSLAESL